MPSISTVSPQARWQRARRTRLVREQWAREQPERARKAQEQWNLVLRKLEKQPEWVLRREQESAILSRWLQWLRGHSLTTRDNPLITLLSYFLNERERIEWRNHLDEMRKRWQDQELSLWLIYFRTSYMTLGFLWAWIHCRVIDYILARYWGKPL
jgi:hypothetical protein